MRMRGQHASASRIRPCPAARVHQQAERDGECCIHQQAFLRERALAGHDHGPHRHLRLQIQQGHRKFSEFDHDICESGLPRLTHDTLATFEVSVDSTIDVGTHLVFIGTVKSAEVVGEGTPITYDYYHRVLRGKTPAKAASYNDGDDPAKDEIVEVEETASSEQKVAWRCKMCGYTVEGYPDGLPEDWRCPLCGMGRDYFEKVLI